jgi:hypothetical protein
MYSFAQRPRRRGGSVYRRWNDPFPGYDNAVCHYDAAAPCWADANMETSCGLGDHIALVPDTTVYKRHMVRSATAASHILALDSGFPAFFNNTSGNAKGSQLRTPLAFACPFQIAVLRSTSPTWSYYGAALGGYSNYDYKQYVLYPGATSFYNWPYPLAVRKNGVELAQPFDLGVINQPMVVAIAVRYPEHVINWELGSTTHTNDYNNTHFASMYLYEVIGFSGRPDPDTLAEIEVSLMDKYGISAS